MLRQVIRTIGVAGVFALALQLLAASPRPIFVDVSRASGLDFQHFNGGTGNYTLAEITGSGGAMFDYDGDGRLDIYLVQGKLLGKDMSEAISPWHVERHPHLSGRRPT